MTIYYIKKVNQGKAKKVAIIAVAHKLLRIIYGVWKNGEFFRAGLYEVCPFHS